MLFWYTINSSKEQLSNYKKRKNMKLSVNALFIGGQIGVANYVTDSFPNRKEVPALDVLVRAIKEIHESKLGESATLQSSVAEFILNNKMLPKQAILPTGIMTGSVKVALLLNYPHFRQYVDIKSLTSEQQVELLKQGVISITEYTYFDFDSIALEILDSLNVDEIIFALKESPDDPYPLLVKAARKEPKAA